jgi:hypothetical protein
VIEILLRELRDAHQHRHHWHSLIAQEVLAEPKLLNLVRLCGLREMTAFALGAFIGDIQRFSDPKKLVKYVGLNPAFDDSGESEWHGGIGGHGNKYLRCLLIEGAQAILRCGKNALGQWGRKLLGRKGAVNLAVAAVARKLTVAVWYLMMGRWSAVEEIDERLGVKVSKIIGQVGAERLKELGKSTKTLRQEVYQMLKSISSQSSPPPAQSDSPTKASHLPKKKAYLLDPQKTFTPKAKTNSLAAEYGLA